MKKMDGLTVIECAVLLSVMLLIAAVFAPALAPVLMHWDEKCTAKQEMTRWHAHTANGETVMVPKSYMACVEWRKRDGSD